MSARKGSDMNNLKQDIFGRGVVVTATASEAGRERAGKNFCNVPLEQPVLLNGSDKRTPSRRFTPEVVVTYINPSEYHEDTGFHESEEPGFESHLDAGFMGFDAVVDSEQLLDKWCRVQT
jgi:hypothetical protein